ncbi:uncharacterized protein LOC107038089 [Diachasma alloeum]|uniref:Odorant receptor n=1 Tax=Diachasma alloeum TaxID=454923 RepID=A0A4E0S119_9HYME|nr:uncharacterized protein LOC107038089 [Diachasma alloeum]THK33020.1 odorant receptor 136 [Diachasma alloeum]
MDNIFDYSCYRFTKHSLQCIGHWPFQSRRDKIFLRCLTFFLISTILIPKIIKLIESLNDLDMVVECLPIIGCYIVGMIKFFNWIIMEDHMKQLLLTIKRNWEDLNVESELEVLHQYSDQSRRLNIAYTTCCYSVLLFYFCSPAVPKILDIIKPLNGSRPRIPLYHTEFFIDQDKYYVHLLIHAYLTVPVGLSYAVFFDNLFATLIHHACGMIEILKLRLEALHIKNTTQGPIKFEIVMNRIRTSSDLQTEIFKFIEKLEAAYSFALLIIVAVNMILIITAGVAAVVKMSHPNEMIRVTIVNMCALTHLFWSSWLGHNLIVHSEHIFLSTLSKWYLSPSPLQSILIPIMVRSMKPCRLTAGKLYTMSMESFGAMVKTIMSFMTVLNSMR